MGEYQGCDICKHQKKSKREKPCLECTKNRAINNFEPMTNADAIRNFSDGELAEFMVTIQKIALVMDRQDSVEEALQFLQAEVKEDDTDE